MYVALPACSSTTHVAYRTFLEVYYENGAQIIPPHDSGIAARIEANLEPWSAPHCFAALVILLFLQSSIHSLPCPRRTPHAPLSLSGTAHGMILLPQVTLILSASVMMW